MQWHRCMTNDIYECSYMNGDVVFRNKNTKQLCNSQMCDKLYSKELKYWFGTRYVDDGDWNSSPYYINYEELCQLLGGNDCLYIPMHCGIFHTNITIKLDRASELRSKVCIVDKQKFADTVIYSKKEHLEKIDVLNKLSVQNTWRHDLEKFQNKYELEKGRNKKLKEKIKLLEDKLHAKREN